MEVRHSEAYEALNNYYSSYNEQERFSYRPNSVEFITTKKYIERYLAPGAKILEIGAGSGRYSHHFAQMGYAVDAVELVPRNIELFRENTKDGENVTVVQGSATDLSMFKDNTYDITLLLGPMYHLFTAEEQKLAIAEALRVTKPGGILAVSYCMNEATIIGYGFFRDNIRSYLERGMIDPDTFQCFSTPAELFVLWRPDTIFALTEPLPVKRLHFIGTDMYTNYFREQIDAMDDELFEIYLKYHLSICERQDMVGISHHTLDILRKDDKI